ncbi:Response regulator rcp1 [bioreactor metagenome]|jgi:CheY-like chemotaxis protein|uniref:Response regulator rcp1 n=1 Tax=bioreactor metagenome TaxID=1076179 RepID=A0A644W8Y2_9ZZZZ|nr:response regulator [Paludibacter sp.]
MSYNREIIILIAEDDDGHAELIVEGLRETGLKNQIIRFDNGSDIWDYLVDVHKEGGTENNAEYLVMLDINMPLVDGTEVLRRIKNRDDMKNIPVIMLTTTDDPREIEKCYQLGCNVYITKPVEFIKFAETLQKLGFFLQIIKV